MQKTHEIRCDYSRWPGHPVYARIQRHPRKPLWTVEFRVELKRFTARVRDTYSSRRYTLDEVKHSIAEGRWDLSFLILKIRSVLKEYRRYRSKAWTIARTAVEHESPYEHLPEPPAAILEAVGTEDDVLRSVMDPVLEHRSLRLEDEGGELRIARGGVSVQELLSLPEHGLGSACAW